MLTSPAVMGFGTGLSLIVAIGAQNAYVLRQGITRQHVWITVIICALSDAVLITAGIAGIGALIERAGWILTAARIAGALFLGVYALSALRRALVPNALSADQSAAGSSRPRIILTTLALTWLNPHVYLDTVLLLGSIGNSFGEDKWHFALGAVCASVLWFCALGVGARSLAKVFAKPKAWQVLDFGIFLFMAYFALRLLLPVL